jgi:mannose-6-phosphate isomerase-like protein (cupin superfamily)
MLRKQQKEEGWNIKMLIDFSTLDETVVKNFRGGEKDTHARMFADENNRIMYIKLKPGASIGFHKHDAGSEIVYILQGKGTALFDSAEEDLQAGICHYCPKGHAHSLINNGQEDLIFFAVVPNQ